MSLVMGGVCVNTLDDIFAYEFTTWPYNIVIAFLTRLTEYSS